MGLSPSDFLPVCDNGLSDRTTLIGFAVSIKMSGIRMKVTCSPFLCSCSMSGEVPDTVQISDKVLKVLKVDDAVNTTFVCEVKNRIGTGRDQVTAIVRGEWKGREQPHTPKQMYQTREQKKKTARAETILKVQIMFDNKPKPACSETRVAFAIKDATFILCC